MITITTTLGVTQFSSHAESGPATPIWSQLASLPDRAGVGGCFTGVTGDALLVGGGCNFPDKKIWEGGTKAWLDSVYVLTKLDGQWHRAGKLPRPLSYGVSVTTKQGVVCLGGADAEQHHAEAFMLSWSGKDLQIRPLPSLPTPLAYASAAAIGDTIYVAGGTTKPNAPTPSNKFFALDLSTNRPAWRELESCPGKPRMLAVAGTLDGAFYFAGGVSLEPADGNSKRVYLRDAWCYRPGRGWQQLADLPRPCSAGATPAPTADSTLFVVGGDDSSLVGFQPMEKHPGFSKHILAFDIKSNLWRSLGEAPFPNATVQTASWQGHFIFAAGEPRPGMRSAEVWVLKLSAAK